MSWFMDCYGPEQEYEKGKWCASSAVVEKLPLNSYYSDDLQHLMGKGRVLLERESSGIVRVSFGRSSKGMSPIEIEN